MGFDSLTGEFWYGLRDLHCLKTLTGQGSWEMRMDIKLANMVQTSSSNMNSLKLH